MLIVLFAISVLICLYIFTTNCLFKTKKERISNRELFILILFVVIAVFCMLGYYKIDSLQHMETVKTEEYILLDFREDYFTYVSEEGVKGKFFDQNEIIVYPSNSDKFYAVQKTAYIKSDISKFWSTFLIFSTYEEIHFYEIYMPSETYNKYLSK